MSTDKRTGRGLHYFLAHLAAGVDLIPGLEQLALLGFEPDRTVHLFHSLLSVPVDLYLSTSHLFACRFELSKEGLSLMV